MIDLHSHILPGIDDGSADLAMSLEMGRLAVRDGITHMVCTPHMTPGVYDNRLGAIREAVGKLAKAFKNENIALELSVGADVHIRPDLLKQLDDGQVPVLGRSRCFLFEPPHSIMPPNIVAFTGKLISAGYRPILTHPERFGWTEGHYDVICELERAGVIVQLTAGSILGRFGRRALYWSERMVDDGIVDIIATDAHNLTSRPPILSEARDVLVGKLGEEEALNMVLHRPAAILAGGPVPPKPPREASAGNDKRALRSTSQKSRRSRLLDKLLGR